MSTRLNAGRVRATYAFIKRINMSTACAEEWGRR